jgi:RNA polymerase sigma-70 factor, ECF subfamily
VIVARRWGHWPVMRDVISARSEVTDHPLAENAPSPDIETLLNEHFAFIWRVFRRMGLCRADADDATQQVFVIASTKLHRMTPSRERAYLYGIALRVQSHVRRAQRRRREVPVEEADELAAPAVGPDTQAGLAEAWRLLDELLAQLPEKLGRVLVLAEIEGLEVPEIASFEGIPVGTAASRLRLARERFRTLLAKQPSKNPFGGRA